MKTGKFFVLIVGLLGLAALPLDATADHKSKHNSSHPEQYTLEFDPTQNAFPGVHGVMTIKVVNGHTVVHFRLRGGYPNMVYTIWIVYNILDDAGLAQKISNCQDQNPATPCDAGVPSFPTGPIRTPGFPAGGLGVGPPSPLKKPLTDGMGLDPGLTFVTDDRGNGEKQIKLDYNLLGLGEAAAPGNEDGPPVANKNFVTQCLPGLPNPNGKCPNGTGPINVASTWLRKFIIDVKPEDRVLSCANYDPASDPTNAGAYDPVVPGMDARYWQCIDPATLKDPDDPWSGLPRVYRYKFNHFRLAPHPDALTHGLFGGNSIGGISPDHFIEAVGRRCEISPLPPDCE